MIEAKIELSLGFYLEDFEARNKSLKEIQKEAREWFENMSGSELEEELYYQLQKKDIYVRQYNEE